MTIGSGDTDPSQAAGGGNPARGPSAFDVRQGFDEGARPPRPRRAHLP